MPSSRSKLIAPSLTVLVCLIAIVWILTSLSEMRSTSNQFCSKASRHGLELAKTFISLLPGEIPVYPRGVLPSDSPAALFAEKLVNQGEVRRLTLLDRNERSILTAGHNSFGVYTPFPKGQVALKEGLLLEDMRGVALSVPVDRNGAIQATVGILLPASARIYGYYFFKSYYPHMLASAFIILIVSGSTLLTVALDKPVNPLSAFLQSALKHLPNPFRQPADTSGIPPETIFITPLHAQFTSPPHEYELPTHTGRQTPDITETAQDEVQIKKETPPHEQPAATRPDSESVPQLTALFDEAFAELARLRNVDNIVYLSSCRENPPSVGIGITALKQIMLSLMLNACDMMPDGGKLVIRGKLEIYDKTNNEQKIRVDVLDSGKGLSAKQQRRIFDPAYKPHSLPTEITQRLAEIKNMLERSGGHIDLKSQPGKGSCFTAWLPL